MDVGFIGLGAMGSRMAGNLVKAGHDVTAWNRSVVTPPDGVTLIDSPADVARATAQTFVVVGGPSDVEQVVFGENGWASGAAPGSVLIQATTVGPTAVRALAQQLGQHGVRVIDAPVAGSTGPAAAGELVILAGGDAADIERAAPLFDAVGSKTLHFGGVGTGSAVKLMSNTVLLAALGTAAEMWAWMAEHEPDLDVEEVAAAMHRISPFVAARLPDVASDPLPPGFAIRHAAKDVRLALTEAETGTVLRAVLDSLTAAEETGFADVDISSLGASARKQRNDR